MTGASQGQREREGATATGRIVQDVRAGLLSVPRSLPCMYFYDDAGSRLFEQITRQPEYYQTRTEEALLERIAPDIVDRVQPAELVELGSGVGRKVRLILDAMRARSLLQRCVLFDINALYLRTSVARLAAEYRPAGVSGIEGDFQRDLQRLGRAEPRRRRLLLLLAGTVGNIHPQGLPAFLGSVRLHLAPGDGFLVGVDLIKDGAALEQAYNDRAGVTAAFNRNILAVINRELGADFRPDSWEHVAFWDPERAWIEMRLRSVTDQRVTIPALELELRFRRGEELRTELSAKYSRESFAARLAPAGLVLDQWHTDDRRQFALALLRPAGLGAS